MDDFTMSDEAESSRRADAMSRDSPSQPVSAPFTPIRLVVVGVN
jgi:hypothetical protein